MKTRRALIVISGIIIVLSIALFSCTTSRKTAIACPEFSRYRTARSEADHGRYNNKNLTANNRGTKFKHHNNSSGRAKVEDFLTFKHSTGEENNPEDYEGNVTSITKMEFNEGLLASLDNHIIQSVRKDYYSYPVNNPGMTEPLNGINPQAAGCDTIVLKSGSVLLGKVEEIGQVEVRYRKCVNLNGPVISILKSDITIIKYSNGTHDSIVSDMPIPVGNPDLFATHTNSYAPPKTEGLAIAGFIAGLVGLFFAGIPLGTLAVIFGMISINKIRKYPARFSGRGLAIASIVIGIVSVIGAIIVLAAM
jgi:hypothetical protein